MTAEVHPRAGLPASPGHEVEVGSPQAERLLALLGRFGFAVRRVGAHQLRVGGTAEEIRSVARFFGVPLSTLIERGDR